MEDDKEYKGLSNSQSAEKAKKTPTVVSLITPLAFFLTKQKERKGLAIRNNEKGGNVVDSDY
jgi:hypothetical protein